jgi:hypothetical protein
MYYGIGTQITRGLGPKNPITLYGIGTHQPEGVGPQKPRSRDGTQKPDTFL